MAAVIASSEHKAHRLIEQLKMLNEEMGEVNDYGSSYGFCEAEDRLVQDVDDQLGSLLSRASQLLERLKVFKRVRAQEEQQVEYWVEPIPSAEGCVPPFQAVSKTAALTWISQPQAEGKYQVRPRPVGRAEAT
jgi:hypothetical protein